MEISAFGALGETIVVFTSSVSLGEQDLHLLPPTEGILAILDYKNNFFFSVATNDY